MAIIYKAKSQCGMVYVGCTTQQLSIRIAAHKHHSKTRDYNEFQRLVRKNGIEYFKFSTIEECKDEHRFEREMVWIAHYKSKNKSLNNADGGQGPNGHTRPPHAVKIAGDAMRKRWAENRSLMLKRVNAHKDKAFYHMAGLAGGHGKAAKQPWFRVYERSSGKLIGRFQTTRELGKVIGVSESTSGRYLAGKRKKGNELYKFVWE
jgi:hypothetical protein